MSRFTCLLRGSARTFGVLLVLFILVAPMLPAAAPPGLPLPIFQTHLKEHPTINIALSPDGSLLAHYVYGNKELPGLKVWDLREKKYKCEVVVPSVRPPHTEQMTLSFSYNGKAILIVGSLYDGDTKLESNHAYLIDVTKGKIHKTIRLPPGIGDLASFTSDCKAIVFSDQGCAAVLYDTNTFKEIGRLPKGEEKMPTDFPKVDPKKPNDNHLIRVENLTSDLVISPGQSHQISSRFSLVSRSKALSMAGWGGLPTLAFARIQQNLMRLPCLGHRVA